MKTVKRGEDRQGGIVGACLGPRYSLWPLASQRAPAALLACVTALIYGIFDLAIY